MAYVQSRIEWTEMEFVRETMGLEMLALVVPLNDQFTVTSA